MIQFLIVNVLIICLIALGIIFTSNPLFIFGLMFLVSMPYGGRDAEDESEEDESQPMGFNAKLK
jgi:hypothetical protein